MRLKILVALFLSLTAYAVADILFSPYSTTYAQYYFDGDGAPETTTISAALTPVILQATYVEIGYRNGITFTASPFSVTYSGYEQEFKLYTNVALIGTETGIHSYATIIVKNGSFLEYTRSFGVTVNNTDIFGITGNSIITMDSGDVLELMIACIDGAFDVRAVQSKFTLFSLQ